MSVPSVCPRCEQGHGGAVDCNGTQIDWAARKARASAYLKRRQTKWVHVGKDENGRDKYASMDMTTYDADALGEERARAREE